MGRIQRIQGAYERHGFRGLLRLGLSEPERAIEALISTPQHFYTLENPVYWEDVVTVIPPIVDADTDRVIDVWQELVVDSSFEKTIESSFARTTERPDKLHSNWREFLYILVRLSEPDIVIETGVQDGLSSTYILKALQRNSNGTLISIDINDQTRLPSDLDNPDAGWLVASDLRDRWDLRFGDSRNILPEVVTSQPPDIFFHDSLHTKEHMRFEFQTAIERMVSGGLIVADNSRFNDVFRRYAEDAFTKTAFWKNTEYALSPDREKVDDRLGIGLVD